MARFSFVLSPAGLTLFLRTHSVGGIGGIGGICRIDGSCDGHILDAGDIRCIRHIHHTCVRDIHGGRHIRDTCIVRDICGVRRIRHIRSALGQVSATTEGWVSGQETMGDHR